MSINNSITLGDSGIRLEWAYDRMQKRIAELEAALRPFADLLDIRTDEIDPRAMYMLREDKVDADLLGKEIIAARKAMGR